MRRRRKGYAGINDDGELVTVQQKEYVALSTLGVWRVVECYVTYNDGKRTPPKRRKAR